MSDKWKAAKAARAARRAEDPGVQIRARRHSISQGKDARDKKSAETLAAVKKMLADNRSDDEIGMLA